VIFSKEETDEAIKAFSLRVKNEAEFCNQLFEEQTVRVLAMKYRYYVTNDPVHKDAAFDLCEWCWYVMGVALKKISREDTSPCIGFDHSHPDAAKAVELAISWGK